MKPGRPRNFDYEAALEAAMRVFWLKGFSGTSLSDLTEATGLNKPSLYGAFGDKAQFYLKVLERYGEQEGARHARLLERADLRGALEDYLGSLAEMFAGQAQPNGCLVVTGSADCGTGRLPSEVERALQAVLDGGDSLLVSRFERARIEGQLALDCEPAALASFISTLQVGLAHRLKAGATLDALQPVIQRALSALPLI